MNDSKNIFLRAISTIVAFAGICFCGYAVNTVDSALDVAADSSDTERLAVVNLSSIYMRAQPDYESPLETQELMGQIVKVIGESSYWRHIVSDQPYTAWCTEKGLVEMSAEEIAEYVSAPKLIVTSLYSHLYALPDTGSQPMTDLVCGDLLKYAGKNHGRGNRIWIEAMLPSGEKGWVRRSDVSDYGKWKNATDDSADSIIATAMQFVGVPYLWGGMTSKGFDCSGLVRICYMMNGILLPRNASQQVFCGENVPVCSGHGDYAKNISVTVKALRPGDLLFFGIRGSAEKQDRITHVGIYLGNGRMIHSSHLVRVNSLIPGEYDYYENSWKLIRACRIIGHESEGRNGYMPRLMK